MTIIGVYLFGGEGEIGGYVGIGWDDIIVKAGTQRLTSDDNVIYDTGEIEGVLDGGDVVCNASSGLDKMCQSAGIDRACSYLRETPSQDITTIFGDKVKAGATLSDLASEKNQMGSTDNDFEVNADATTVAGLLLVAGMSLILGIQLGLRFALGPASLGIMLGLPANRQQNNVIDGFSGMGPVA